MYKLTVYGIETINHIFHSILVYCKKKTEHHIVSKNFLNRAIIHMYVTLSTNVEFN